MLKADREVRKEDHLTVDSLESAQDSRRRYQRGRGPRRAAPELSFARQLNAPAAAILKSNSLPLHCAVVVQSD